MLAVGQNMVPNPSFHNQVRPGVGDVIRKLIVTAGQRQQAIVIHFENDGLPEDPPAHGVGLLLKNPTRSIFDVKFHGKMAIRVARGNLMPGPGIDQGEGHRDGLSLFGGGRIGPDLNGNRPFDHFRVMPAPPYMLPALSNRPSLGHRT